MIESKVKSLDEVISRLQYKADNIKTKLEVSYFTECIDYLKSLPRIEGEWIPCSERLPEDRDWYLAVFEEPDTGFVGLPYIADYLMGKHTRFTTEDGWIIANCTDVEDEGVAAYYKKLKCIAWQPLPEPYQEVKIDE